MKMKLLGVFLAVSPVFGFSQNDTIVLFGGKNLIGNTSVITETEVQITSLNGKMNYVHFYDIHAAFFDTPEESQAFWNRYNAYWMTPDVIQFTRPQIYRAGQSLINFGTTFYGGMGIGLVGGGMTLAGYLSGRNIMAYTGMGIAGGGSIAMIVSVGQLIQAGKTMRGSRRK